MVDEKDVLDFATEMGVEMAVEGPLKMLLRGAQRYANRNNDALREAWEMEARDRQARVLHAQATKLNELGRTVVNHSEFLAKVEVMVNDHQFWRLQANLGYEALRSTLDSRKEMLEAAAIGLADPKMSIERKARVERTLRGLDPQDVFQLEKLRRYYDDAPHKKENEAVDSQSILGAPPLSLESLLISGCVRADDSKYDGPVYVLSNIGRLVLRALSSYAPLARGRIK